MKLKKAMFYRFVAQKSMPQYKPVIDCITDNITQSALRGYTKTVVNIGSILETAGLEVSGEKFTSLRNLIIKELEDNGFGFKYENDEISIYW